MTTPSELTAAPTAATQTHAPVAAMLPRLTGPPVPLGPPLVLALVPPSAAATPDSPVVAAFFGGLDVTTRLLLMQEMDGALEEAFDVRDASGTQRNYEFTWTQYEAFCDVNGLGRLEVQSTARYLTWLIVRRDVDGEPAGLAWGTVKNRLSALNRYFAERGCLPPGSNTHLKLALRGFQRVLAAQGRVLPRKVTALRLEGLRAVIATTRVLPVAGVRDQTLLVLAQHELTPTQITSLDWATFRPGSAEVRWIRPEGGDIVLPARPQTPQLCPVVACGAWSRAMGFPVAGPMFARLDSQDRPMSEVMSRQAVVHVVRRWMAVAGAEVPASQRFPEMPPELVTLAVAAAGRVRLIDERDRSLLLVGWRTAVRRSNMADFCWGDLELQPEGYAVRLRWTKVNQLGRHQFLGVEHTGNPTCPVSALSLWKARLELELGRALHDAEPVFPRIDRHGHLLTDAAGQLHALSGEGVGLVVKGRAARAGLVGDFNGHSLRRGFISECVKQGIPMEQIQRTSLHSSIDSLMEYVEEEGSFVDSVGRVLGM